MLVLSNAVDYSGREASGRHKPEETAALRGLTHADHGQLEVIYNTNYETSCGWSNR